MNIPKQIKVGGINYQVEEKETVAIGENKNYLGSCSYYDQKIEIKSDLGDERKEQVFIHELTHAIFNEAGYDEHDEDEINRVAIVLHQVLKENDFKN